MPSTGNVGMADTLKTSLMQRSIGPCELLACILGADFPLGSSHLLVTTRFCPGKRKVTITDTGGRRTDFARLKTRYGNESVGTWPMFERGQTEKDSARADVFRF